MTWRPRSLRVLKSVWVQWRNAPRPVLAGGFRGRLAWAFIIVGAAIDPHDDLFIEWSSIRPESDDRKAMAEEWVV